MSLDFKMKAAKLRALVEDRFWDETRQFYENVPKGENREWVDIREEIGYVPWYFNLPLPGHEAAWKQLIDWFKRCK
jgi:hypothetical protein